MKITPWPVRLALAKKISRHGWAQLAWRGKNHAMAPEPGQQLPGQARIHTSTRFVLMRALQRGAKNPAGEKSSHGCQPGWRKKIMPWLGPAGLAKKNMPWLWLAG